MVLIACIMLLTTTTLAASLAPLAPPHHLETEFLPSPALNIGTLQPRFDFVVTSTNASERGLVMSALHVVCRAALSGHIVWDSGVTAATRAVGIYYGAIGNPAVFPLVAGQVYTWTAQWLSSDGRVSPTSEPAQFGVALLSESDWHGTRWFGVGHRELRTTLDLRTSHSGLTVAYVHVSSPGGSVLLVNGVLAGRDAVGMSAWLDFTASMPSTTLNIGPLLRAGEANELVLRIGCGYWHAAAIQTRLCFLLSCAFWGHTELRPCPGGIRCPTPVPTDQHSGRAIHTAAGAQPLARVAVAVCGSVGADRSVGTDRCWDGSCGRAAGELTLQRNLSWEGRIGPTVYDSAWLGTITDWRVARGSGWETAREVPTETLAKDIAPEVRPLPVPPPRTLEALAASTVRRTADGAWVYEFGAMVVGIATLARSAVVGAGNVTLEFCEALLADDSCLRQNGYKLHGVTDVHIIGGDGEPSALSAQFSWRGFLFVRVTTAGGASFSGALDAITAHWTSTHLEEAAQLSLGGETASEIDAARVLGLIDAMVTRGQRSNLVAFLPTDCPTRERHAWLGDARDTLDEATLRWRAPTVYRLFVQQIVDAQRTFRGGSGAVPVVVPCHGGVDAAANDTSWSAGFVLSARALLRM